MPPLVYIVQKAMEQSKLLHGPHKAAAACECGTQDSVSSPGVGQAGRKSLHGVEFATVLVYSCLRSCWGEDKGKNFVEEHVFVQPDPEDSVLLKVSLAQQ